MEAEGSCRRVLFARIGYMRFYNGSQPGDERPTAGGDYNRDEIGHEIYNFRKVKSVLYGYFQPYLRAGVDRSMVNLQRIDPAASGESLNGVTVIFLATKPGGGQYIVGWYQGAVVYRYYQKGMEGKERGPYNYNVKARAAHAVLLPSCSRSFNVPRGIAGKRKPGLGRVGSPGRANVFYMCDELGAPRDLSAPRYAWIREALDYVSAYDGDNLLDDPNLEGVCDAASAGGQGYSPDPRVREAVEEYAMVCAAVHFRNQGYDVEDVSKSRCFDLQCRRNGTTLKVEVKGTQGPGESIILTRNEVRSAKKGSSALYIMHSIDVRAGIRRCTASGGKCLVVDPWRIVGSRLTALAYTYHMADHP